MWSLLLRRSHLLRWRTIVVLALLASAIVSANFMQEAAAAIRACRGDPVVWLSNGTTLTMVASIAADASQVELITYTVHAPRGLTVSKVVYTGGVLQDKERVNVVFDRTSGYQIEVATDLGATVASVTVDAMVTSMTTDPAATTARRSLSALSTSKIVLLFP
jgi:DeoR/GlpR family transcriptional regulator of sugar metabolism